MKGQKHIINRQVLELTVPERKNALPVQNKSVEIVKYKLQPALDKLFSKLSSDVEIVRINKLVVDLGNITEDNLETALVDQVVKQLDNQIIKLLISSKSNTEKKSPNGSSGINNDNLFVTEKTKDFLAQFVYFLQSGRFPWWHKTPEMEEAGKSPTDFLFAEILKLDNVLLRSSLIPLFENALVRKRIIFQLSHSQIEELLRKLNPNLFKNLSAVFGVLRSLVKTGPQLNELTGFYYEAALRSFYAENEIKSASSKIGFLKEILTHSLRSLSIQEREIKLNEWILSLKTRPEEELSINEILTLAALIQLALELPTLSKFLFDTIQKSVVEKANVIGYLDKLQIKKIKSGRVQDKNIAENVAEADSESKEEIESALLNQGANFQKDKLQFNNDGLSDEIGIQVFNAGLVLFHPFLRYFFEGLNLLDQELRFKSKSEAFKAVHLLQFIATGRETTPENELSLNKILVGLDISEPVPVRIPILEEEKEECVNLIKTVLNRWDALKTTNPLALTETYVQREGLLRHSGKTWNLQIERNSFDIMLEKLPWAIHLVKLPWNAQILYVEW